MNKDVELSNEIDQHDTSVGQRKNRLPDRNRTHDLLPGVPEVTDLIPVGKSQFFFLHPPVMLINSPSTAMELIQGAL